MADFRFSRQGPVHYLESPALAECAFLVHAFCMRQGGISSGSFAGLNFSTRTGDDPERVRGNWEVLSEAFRIPPERFLVVHQVHGDEILAIDGPRCTVSPSGSFSAEADLSCDAMLTDRPGIAIGIKTADCVPIFLVDKVKQVIGAVHAGWRGTALNIAGKAVDRLRKEFSSQTGDILAAIGPSIGPCCYEVDETVFSSFPPSFRTSGCFQPGEKEGRWMFDLARANARQIEERGVPAENIVSAGICTSCSRDLFYSHRRDHGKTGRHLNFIMLRDGKNTSAKNLD